MPPLLVAVADSVFPNLDLARAVVSRAGAELRMASQPTPEGIVAAARDADALLVTYAKINADMIREMKKCRIISRFGIGVDNVDIEAATRQGIVVTKVPDYCIDEVSDHAMALLLSLVRKIPFSSERAHAGRWEMPAVTPIHRLRGTVLGLVGFGRIPQLVAPKAKAFGMRVMAYDPYVPLNVMEQAGVGRLEFAELLKISDYISIHSPLLPETHHLFSDEVFRQMKPGSLIVNTSRGPVVDEAALARALDSKQLAGAALDVLEQEPPVSSPLFGRDNVILTPHTSFYSVESVEELATKAAEE
jgi:D-3-phosphoglycerate dehydrogenase